MSRHLYRYTPTIISAIISLEITVINAAYTPLACFLTDREHHATKTQHQDSLILKLFVVQCANSYASLYYTAFAMFRFEARGAR